MKILVTVKEVAQVDDEFQIDGLDIDDRYLDYDLNEWDDYAVEEAVQLSEAYDSEEQSSSGNRAEPDDDVEVVTVTIGPERSEETIRMALAKGADRAVRVWDDALADTQFLDVSTKADILAAVVKEEEPDLVLSGVQADDDSFGATGVALAERVGFQWAAVVNQLDQNVDANVSNVRRELEGGLGELTEVEGPAVLTIQTGINEPRYASLRGIRQAQRKPLDVQALDDLGFDDSVVESPVDLTSMYEPESEGDAVVWEGSPDETAGELAEFLREQGVIEG